MYLRDKMRYKLRSSSKTRADDSGNAGNGATTSEDCSPPKVPRLQHRRRKKTTHQHGGAKAGSDSDVGGSNGRREDDEAASNCSIVDLPQELVLYVCTYLDSQSLLSFLQTSKWFHSMLSQ